MAQGAPEPDPLATRLLAQLAHGGPKDDLELVPVSPMISSFYFCSMRQTVEGRKKPVGLCLVTLSSSGTKHQRLMFSFYSASLLSPHPHPATRTGS